MDHLKVKDKLSEFYDGELPELEAGQVSDHLKTCAECSAFYEHWKLISQKLFKASGPTPSGSFVTQVMNRIESLESKSQPWSFPVQWLAPAVGVAAMLLVTLITPNDAASMDAIYMGDDMIELMLEAS